jgi:hypothetical protein
MAISSRLSRVFSSGQVSSYLTGVSSLKTGSRGSMVYGTYQSGGRIAGSVTFNVDFLQYVTDTWTQSFATLPASGYKLSTSLQTGFWRCAGLSNYRNAGYLTGGSWDNNAGSLIMQKLDYANRTYSIMPTCGTTTARNQTWGTTNPETAGYTFGGYVGQGSLLGANGIDKLSYTTETAAILGAYFSGNRGLSCGPAHNGKTAGYQMSGSTGAAGGYAATTRISKILYSNDTTSDLASTIAGTARDLASATQNGTVAAYLFSGRGGGTQVDKLAFSSETTSLLANGHSVDVGNGSWSSGANDNGVAIYHFGGDTSGTSNLIEKWNVASGDTRSSVSGASSRANNWESTSLSNSAS